MPSDSDRISNIEAFLRATSDFKPLTDPVPDVPPPVVVIDTPTTSYTIPPEAKTLPAGSKLIGLAPGHYVLEGGDYAINGGSLAGVYLYAADERKAFLRATRQLIITGGGLFGLMGTGGGTKPKLNDYAAFVLRDKAKFVNGRLVRRPGRRDRWRREGNPSHRGMAARQRLGRRRRQDGRFGGRLSAGARGTTSRSPTPMAR
jgi:hypothetical protein